jgi:hypothetical protein
MNINKNIKQYNYLKSIKDKENIIVSYYKKLSHLGNDKPKILPKIKKRTLKNIKVDTSNSKAGGESITKDLEKKTKKQIVIMDD